MKINYHNYNEDIFEKIEKYPENAVYIFENSKFKNKFKEYFSKEYFKEESLFMTMAEFKEKVLWSEKIVLREEKPAILFYKSIPDYIKKELGIKNYYDVIDLAYNFIKLYAKLDEYDIDNLENLSSWQQTLYEYFEEIRKNYKENMEKGNFILQSDLENLKYYNDYYIKDKKNIVFVNILKFNNFEKKIINYMKNNGKNIILELQIKKGDFNEEKLEIEKITFPDNLNLKYYEVNDSNTEMLNIIKELEKNKENMENIKLIAYDKENMENINIISKNIIDFSKKENFSSTNLYYFYMNLHNILKNLEIENGKLYLRVIDIMKAFDNIIFKKYYEVDDFYYNYFLELLNDSYKYIDKKYIEENKKENGIERIIYNIFIDIEKIMSCKNLKDIVNFFEKDIDINKKDYNGNYIFEDIFYKDNIDKYYEALTEIMSIEDINIVNNWEEYFFEKNISESLFRLVLKYFREKPVKKAEIKGSKIFVSDALEIDFEKNKKTIIFNVSDKTFPSPNKDTFFLSDKQKKEIGIYKYDEQKLYEKYIFLKNISLAEEVIIFGIFNEEKGIGRSSFIEELIYNKHLKKEEAYYNNIDFSEFIKKEFDLEKIEENILSDDVYDMNLEIEDFEDGVIELGAYGYETLKKCQYKYYISFVEKIYQNKIKIENKIDTRYLGILAHNVMQKISYIKKEEIKEGNFEISKTLAKSVVEKILRDEKLKIPINYKRYYSEIIFEILSESIIIFYKKLKDVIDNQKISIFAEEKNKSRIINENEYPLIKLKGRSDLIIETDRNKYIIDYKTGNSTNGQLDFYSIIYYGEANMAEKYIYNIFNSKLDIEKSDNTISKDQILIDINKMVNEKKYEKTEKKADCIKCEYIDICRPI